MALQYITDLNAVTVLDRTEVLHLRNTSNIDKKFTFGTLVDQLTTREYNDLTSAPITYVLPATPFDGQKVAVYWKRTSGTNKLTVNPAGGQTIEANGVDINATAQARFGEGIGFALFIWDDANSLWDLVNYIDGILSSGKRFKKFIDGTMIQYNLFQVTTAITTAFGGIFRSAGLGSVTYFTNFVTIEEKSLTGLDAAVLGSTCWGVYNQSGDDLTQTGTMLLVTGASTASQLWDITSRVEGTWY